MLEYLFHCVGSGDVKLAADWSLWSLYLGSLFKLLTSIVKVLPEDLQEFAFSVWKWVVFFSLGIQPLPFYQLFLALVHCNQFLPEQREECESDSFIVHHTAWENSSFSQDSCGGELKIGKLVRREKDQKTYLVWKYLTRLSPHVNFLSWRSVIVIQTWPFFHINRSC